jgi:hypothetical protein
MNDVNLSQTPGTLAASAKSLGDLDDLVRILRKSLPRTKPWQRQLFGHLNELDRLVQVLRMTVIIERSDEEILEASHALCLASRKAVSAVHGSRCDLDTKAAVGLIAELASGVREELHRFNE